MSKNVILTPVLIFESDSSIDLIKAVPYVFFSDKSKGKNRFMVGVDMPPSEEALEVIVYHMCLDLLEKYRVWAKPTDFSPDGVELNINDGKNETHTIDLRVNGLNLN